MLREVFVCRPNASSVSHLLFADDTLIFCEATREYALEINNNLDKYSISSGQLINIEKSEVVFSENIASVRAEEVRGVLIVRGLISTKSTWYSC